MLSQNPTAKRIMIVESPYYQEIAALLRKGAEAVLIGKKVQSYDIVQVPGALEIPAMIAMVAGNPSNPYSGFVALGCVIRGETSHYDIVALESASALQTLAITQKLAIGNGILTVENMAQALERADPAILNKGGFAADACMQMVALAMRYGTGDLP